MSKFDVSCPREDDTSELRINFDGPEESPYEGVSQNFDIQISTFIWNLLIASFVGKHCLISDFNLYRVVGK